jgi:hypothetical protein
VCWGGGLLLLGLQDGVKDCTGKDVVAVIQVISRSKFCMDVIAFHCVKVCAFLLVVEDVHCVVYVAKGVCLFQEVMGKL